MSTALRNIKAIAKRELGAYFSSPVAYVFIVIFLLLTGFFTFSIGNFFEQGQANLDAFFKWHPWLYLFLVPCVGMRLWAEERRLGTMELLLTKPVTIWQAILGKFLASWLFLAIALALTFPVFITVNYLGSPDNGVIIATYLGSLLMAGAYLAISCMTSSLTRNQVISFILSVVICLFLVLCGFPPVTNLLARLDRPWVVDLVASLSVMTHFQPFVSGLVDSRDVLFFLLLIGFALFTNGVIIRSHQAAADRLRRGYRFERLIYSAGGVAAMFVVMVSLYIIAGAAQARIDITADRTHTLSAGTKNILDHLDSRVTLRFYCTQSGGLMPPPLKTYAQHVEDLLREFEHEAKGRLVIEKYDPQPDSDAEESARLNGVEGRSVNPLDPEKIYLGVVASLLDQKFVLPWLAPDRERLLEYDLSRAISHVADKSRPVVGIMSGLPIWGDPPDPFAHPGEYHAEDWAFLTELKKDFWLKKIPLNATSIDSDVNVLLVAHPVEISDATQYAIDQFILRGGKVLAFLDPHAYFDQKHDRSTEFSLAGDTAGKSSLDKLLQSWGLSMDVDKVIADTSFAGHNTQTGDTMPTLLFVTRAGLNPEDVVTSQIDNLMIPFAGAFTGKPPPKLSETVLVRSSPDSELLDNLLTTSPSRRILESFKASNVEYPIAVRLTGDFKTAFPPRPGTAPMQGQLLDGKKKSEVILVADSDLLNDKVSVRAQNVMGHRLVRPVNGNLNFVQSLVEELAGDDNLITSRSRASMDHPFTRVKEMEARAGRQWQEKVHVLESQQREMNTKIKELQAHNGSDQSAILTADQERELATYQKSMAAVNRQLKEVRKNLRQDTEALEFKTKLINIAAVPLLVTLSGLALAFTRARRRPAGQRAPPARLDRVNTKYDRDDLAASRKKVAAAAVLVLLVGGAGFVLWNKSQQTWAAHEAKVGDKALPNFPINSVASIHVKGAEEFHVVHTNGRWRVSERGDYPANFAMVSDFLLKVRDMRILQSEWIGSSQRARLELDQPGSGAGGGTLFEFKDAQDHTLAALLLGKRHDKPQPEGEPYGLHGLFDGRYVLLPGDPNNVLLTSDELAAAQPVAGSWLSRDFFKAENIKLISVLSPNRSESWEISRDSTTSPWVLDNPAAGETLDSKAANLAGEILAFPTFEDVVPKTQAALTRFGLDHPLVITILTDDILYTLKAGRHNPDGVYPLLVNLTGRNAGGAPAAGENSGNESDPQGKANGVAAQLARAPFLAQWIYFSQGWIDKVARPRSEMLAGKTTASAQLPSP
jgi:ABC-type uncharacterized transport system involved in gliding motility auxiliary subunit/ABC-type transport system involved in multi-copper enzyme maturation permease subunit